MQVSPTSHAAPPANFYWPSSFLETETFAWLQEAILPGYFKKCRWFAGKARRLKDVRIKQALAFEHGRGSSFILLVDAYYRTGKLEQYLLPVTYVQETPESPEKSVLCALGAGFLVDAVYVQDFRDGLFEAFAQNAQVQRAGFSLVFEKGSAFEHIDIQKLGSRVLHADQSNTSLFFGEHFFFKFYRKLFRLTNPELEVVRFLSEQTNFTQIPRYAASMTLYKASASEITLGMMQQKVVSEGDAWGLFQEQLTRFIEQGGLEKLHAVPQNLSYLQLEQLEKHHSLATNILDASDVRWIGLLGERTAGMHNALASRPDVANFAPVPFDAEYKAWLSIHFDKLLEKRQQLLGDVQQHLSQDAQPLAAQFKDQIDLIREHFEHVQQLSPVSMRTRIHGDYHLGQVLYQQNDYIILDFEGEPESSISDRKIKHSPLKDVAGMLRSFHYAAYVALYFGPKAELIKQKYPHAEQLSETWFQLVASVYLQAYFKHIDRQKLGFNAANEVEALLRLHLLEKAVYEFGYELNGRPTWAIIPLKGIQQILGEYQKKLAMVKQTSLFTDYDIHLFREGKHYRIYEKMGAHLHSFEGDTGVYFAVWAPNAAKVSVIGDFNYWSPGTDELFARWDGSGIWEGFIPNLKKGINYKYHIEAQNGGPAMEKGDPYGFLWESPPKTASVVWDLDYGWSDESWMKSRHKHNSLEAPMSVYEVHLGSWRRNPDEAGRSLYYFELAKELVDYVKEMGYTHVELMPVMEHPFFGSWGYQITGYFAPSSRFGNPQEFMYLIDCLHQAGIGVIFDWVPSHFPTDGHGLAFFDGTHLYEHADPKKGYHPDWKSYIFNYGRNEVRSFLISNALFWLDKYHADGLRVDAVASMLYLDYSREEGEWIPNEFGGRENLEALSLLKEMNEQAYLAFPDIQTIAEESTAWPMVSRPVSMGGLGFGMKWMMGWMHDTLAYFKENPMFRPFHHDKITFSIMYAFSENFALPLSHDEVVHGKGSMINKMPGDEWQKFANLRLLFGYMFTHPGTKLNFMGAELGQAREWNHDSSLDWHLLDYHLHKGLNTLVKDLNHFYRAEPALYELQFEEGGFEWIDGSDRSNSVITYIRKDKAGKQLQVICNFTPVVRSSYRIGVPEEGVYEEVFNSDKQEYGGSNVRNEGDLTAEYFHYQWKDYSLQITLPPLGLVILRKKETGASKNGLASKANASKSTTALPASKAAAKPKAATKTAAPAEKAPEAKSNAAPKPKAAAKPKAEPKPKTAPKTAAAPKEKVVAKPKAAPKAAASSTTKSPKK